MHVPGSGDSRARRRLDWRDFVVVLAIAALYVVTGRLGLLLAHFQENATLIWAPTGISIAALVLFGKRVWPGVFIGAAITNGIIGTSPVALVCIAAGNTLEAVVGATLLIRVAGFDPGFARLRDVIGFLLFGAVLATTVSATIGVGALVVTAAVEASSFGMVWLIWWLGDAGGAIVVAPLLLVGARGRPPWAAMMRRAETWAALALLVALAILAFGDSLPGSTESLLPALLVFPVLVWVGLRLGPRGATVASFLVGVIAVLGTARGLGPFGHADASGSLFLVWAYVSTIGAVALVLAAAVAERENADLARQRGEQERAGLAAQIQHAQRLESLGMLAGGVAHDFNNLLVPIRGNAELLKLDGIDDAQRGAMLDAIELAADQAAKLCRQLLSYAGHNRLDKQRSSLASIVEEMLPLLRSSTPRMIELSLVEDAQPTIEGDRGQLGQVLMNLVINATESIGDVEGRICVTVGEREVDQAYLAQTFLYSDAPAGRYAVLEVSDTGCGMTPDTMERIFDPFFSTKKTGRGLGMASVLGIVVAHEGAIKARSRPGAGTTFEILLPVAPELEEVGAFGEPKPERQRFGVTVLVADDEDEVRSVTRRILEGAGYEVLEAHDGVEAIELFLDHRDRVALVVFDVSMPRLSGVEALAKIQELSPGTPGILISGYDEGRVDSTSGTLFLQKPFRRHALLDCVAQSLPARGAVEPGSDGTSATRYSPTDA